MGTQSVALQGVCELTNLVPSANRCEIHMPSFLELKVLIR